jgi:hypothetical protein
MIKVGGGLIMQDLIIDSLDSIIGKLKILIKIDDETESCMGESV